MCGIFGVYSFKNQFINKAMVKDSAMLMKHRGPDAYGQWGVENTVEFAHLRLSIIDLSQDSNQPFLSSCKRYSIVYNGEIFNYLEVREQLKRIGYTFRTDSDTEVLLNSYIEWGDACVNKFNGDWAFAIYDTLENSLYCSRDRFGVKPFNYAIINDQFVFSSEIKSIINYFPELKLPNYNVISNYCRNSLGAQIEQTWFEGIKRLLPGNNLRVSNSGIKMTPYWEYPQTVDRTISFEEANATYKEIFTQAVKLRMRSDVPIGTTLSSGIDSSSIVSVLRSLNFDDHSTFTAIFNQEAFQKNEMSVYKGDLKVNEADLVKRLAISLNLDSHLISVDKLDLIRELSNVIYFLESGHSSPATMPLSQILEQAKEHVKVILEGQGADELLGGYIINTFPAVVIECLKRGNLTQLYNEVVCFSKNYSMGYAFKQFFRLLNNDFIERVYQYSNGTNAIYGEKLKNYTRIKDYPIQNVRFDNYFNKVLYKSHIGGLGNLLHYGDAISMSKSIESRLPFMDVNLVEFVFKLPFDYKMYNGLGKYIHRTSMKDIVPSFILDNPIKFGFNTPLSIHFSSLKSPAIQILMSDQCISRNLFDRKGLFRIINEQISGKRDLSTQLYRLLSVELWFREFIDK